MFTPIGAAATAAGLGGIPLAPMMDAISKLYGVAGSISDFIDRHIEDLKKSDQAAIAKTGRVLEAVKTGFAVGYMASVAVIAVGQLILGNPLSAAVTVGKAVLLMNPAAMTCAAIGAICYGWGALSKEDREAIIDRVQVGLGIAGDLVRGIIAFARDGVEHTVGFDRLDSFKSLMRAEAESLGRTLGDITRSAQDVAADLVSKRPKPDLELQGNEVLVDVLRRMSDTEIRKTLEGLGSRIPEQGAHADLINLVVKEFGRAAANSLKPFGPDPEYGSILVIVSRNLKIPVPVSASASEIERMVLFKVLEMSLERMPPAHRAKLQELVQKELADRGIHGKVAFDELFRFIKFAGLDVGGTLGGLVLAAPGLSGLAGLNFLQFVVLKGILLTYGYYAGFTAILGFGTGGALMALAGAAGPIGAALAVLYTVYSLSGPAYRKLIPAVCAIAAKRIELVAVDPRLVHSSSAPAV